MTQVISRRELGWITLIVAVVGASLVGFAYLRLQQKDSVGQAPAPDDARNPVTRHAEVQDEQASPTAPIRSSDPVGYDSTAESINDDGGVIVPPVPQTPPSHVSQPRLATTDPAKTPSEELAPRVTALARSRMRIPPDARQGFGPVESLNWCTYWIRECMTTDATADVCVNSVPKCVAAEPWKDPAREPCCPSECVRQYFSSRKNEDVVDAFTDMLHSGCFPGIPARGRTQP